MSERWSDRALFQIAWAVIIPLLLAVITTMASLEVIRLRKEAQRIRDAYNLSQKLLSEVKNTSDAFYIVNSEGNCVFITDGMLRLIRMERSDCIEKNMHAVLHHHRKDGTEYPIEECEMFRAFRDMVETSVDGDAIWDSRNCLLLCKWTSSPFFFNGEGFTRIRIDAVYSVDCDNPLRKEMGDG